ncbi:hypothetical protein Gotri_014351, partial [Gossypium trilobum]|nr:hypothetical protein [Gossypium trilobum]
MSTLVVEVSGEKVKVIWDKRLTELLYDICKAYSQRQLKNRWDALKKEWKAWKKLKGGDIGLGWNPIKGTFDVSNDSWEIQKFRTSGINLELEGMLDQMFMGVVATSDKAWTPSSSTLHSEFFEDVNNNIIKENEEENARNDVHILNDAHISNDVHIDGNGQKRKTPKISTSHFKMGMKKFSKQIGGATRLSDQIEKLCNVVDNMRQVTCSLDPAMDPYGIPQAVIMLDNMSEEVPK